MNSSTGTDIDFGIGIRCHESTQIDHNPLSIYNTVKHDGGSIKVRMLTFNRDEARWMQPNTEKFQRKKKLFYSSRDMRLGWRFTFQQYNYSEQSYTNMVQK